MSSAHAWRRATLVVEFQGRSDFGVAIFARLEFTRLTIRLFSPVKSSQHRFTELIPSQALQKSPVAPSSLRNVRREC